MPKEILHSCCEVDLEEVNPSEAELVKEEVPSIVTENVVNAEAVVMETRKDTLLKKVLQFTKPGWPTVMETELMPYYRKRLKLAVNNGVLIWDSRVVIPPTLQVILLKDLQLEHTGMVCMKQLARQYVWWPSIDRDIEDTVKLCSLLSGKCYKTSPNTWYLILADWPLETLTLGFCGALSGKNVFGTGRCLLEVHRCLCYVY